MWQDGVSVRVVYVKVYVECFKINHFLEIISHQLYNLLPVNGAAFHFSIYFKWNRANGCMDERETNLLYSDSINALIVLLSSCDTTRLLKSA